MPPPGELSLRHLPDVSDTSFSFQIPGAVEEYNLIAEDNLDFFSGVNASDAAALLRSPPPNTAPLTLLELTPRPAFEARTSRVLRSSRRLSPEEEHSAKDNQKEETRATRFQQPERSKVRTKGMSNLRPIAPSLVHPSSADAPPSPAPMVAPKKDIDTLPVDLPVPLSPKDQEPMAMDNQRPKGIRRASLEKKLLPSRAERRRKLVPRNKQIVLEGGVTNSRPTNNASEIRSPARISNSVERPSSPIFPSYTKPIVSEDLNGDDSMTDTSMAPSGGVAARLVQYGQQFTTSFGAYASSPFLTVTEPINEPHAALTITPKDIPSTSLDSDEPLTLSQISPRKCPSTTPRPPTPPAKRSASTERSSSKRPASALSENQPRKKGKTDAPPAKRVEAGPSSSLAATRPRRQIVPRRPAANALASSSRSKPVNEEIPQRQTRGEMIASTVRRTQPSREASKAMTKSSMASTVSSSRSTRVLRNSRARDEDTRPPASSLSLSKGKGKASSNSQTSERLIPPPWDGTKSAPLQSSTDSRLLARTGGPSKGDADLRLHSQSQRERKHYVPIPNFQAMHAAQEAKLALLKENIHPTVPQPIRLVTDLRVKERQKFDEMIKEKELEQGRLDEERRREREEQDERELRELRKKTIPKAHGVPEWYKGAPRKKDSKFDSLGR